MPTPRLFLAVLLMLLFAVPGVSVWTAAPLPSRASGLQVDVWTDRGEGAVYRENEPYAVYFRTSYDCFVTLYEIDTEGFVRLIFPQWPDEGFVYGGVTYRLPDYYTRDPLLASGSRGLQFVQAIATDTPNRFRYRAWRDRYEFEFEPVTGDPFIAINSINERLLPRGYLRAQATTSFFVGGPVWYPRYACTSCHGGVRGRFDPYRDVCTRYTVVTAVDYDYFWEYDYHPRLVSLTFASPFWRFELRTGGHWRRPHHHYIDCAYGYSNYHPLRPPTYRYVYRERDLPRRPEYRDYQRDYRPVTYDRSRDRRSGPTRDRDGIAPSPSTGSRDRGSWQTTPTPPSSGSRDRGTTPAAPSIDSRDRGSSQSTSATPPSGSRDRGLSPVPPSSEDRDRGSSRATPTTPPSGNRDRGSWQVSPSVPSGPSRDREAAPSRSVDVSRSRTVSPSPRSDESSSRDRGSESSRSSSGATRDRGSR